MANFPRCLGTVADDDWGAVLSCAFLKKTTKTYVDRHCLKWSRVGSIKLYLFRWVAAMNQIAHELLDSVPCFLVTVCYVSRVSTIPWKIGQTSWDFGWLLYTFYIYFGWLLVHFATTMIDMIEIPDLRMHQKISSNHRYFIFPSWFYMSSQSSRLITHLPSFLPRQTLIGCGDDRCLEKGEGRQHHHLDPGQAWLHHGHHLYRKKHKYNHMHMYACTYAKMYAHTQNISKYYIHIYRIHCIYLMHIAHNV